MTPCLFRKFYPDMIYAFGFLPCASAPLMLGAMGMFSCIPQNSSFSAAPQKRINFCTNCGTRLSVPFQKFCTECGNRIR